MMKIKYSFVIAMKDKIFQRFHIYFARCIFVILDLQSESDSQDKTIYFKLVNESIEKKISETLCV